MIPFRSRRHTIFAATTVVYLIGITAAWVAGVKSVLAVTTLWIAVAAWSYGIIVAVPVMLCALIVSAMIFARVAGPAGVLILHPFDVIFPIAIMECLLIVGLSSLRRVELRQTVAEAELRHKNDQLQAALAEVRELRGLLPICAWCKSIRDVDGMWSRLESYLARHSHAKLTHGVCPECMERMLAESLIKDNAGRSA